MFLDDAVLTLTKLGLTTLESKVYLILCKYDELSTKQISKLSEIAQSDVYRVLKTLQKKGLVEKRIENPSTYKSVQFETGSTFLLNRKKSEYRDLKRKMSQLNKQFQKTKKVNCVLSEESHFLMIPKRENVVKRIIQAIDRSEKSVDLYLSWKRFYRGMTQVFTSSIEKAWTRGVQFRIVAEAPKETAAQKKASEFCRISPNCKVRFMPDRPKTVLGLYDQKEVFIIINPKEGLFDSPALWSNNQSLITAIQEYFDLLWLVSSKHLDQIQF